MKIGLGTIYIQLHSHEAAVCPVYEAIQLLLETMRNWKNSFFFVHVGTEISDFLKFSSIQLGKSGKQQGAPEITKEH